MILIIGGAYQGKTSYVKEKYGVREEEILPCSDKVMCEMLIKCLLAEKNVEGMLGEMKCITGVHVLVKDLQEASANIEEVMRYLLTVRPDIILVMDEIGLGIVPIQREDRDYREVVGRMGCFLAKRASRVDRVLCGIGQTIKEE